MIDTAAASALVRSQIVQHNRAALSSRPACSECPSCASKDWWRRKDMRQRGLWFLEWCKTVGQVVVTSQAVTLVRFKCKFCGFTATEYPHFRPSL